MSAYQKSLDLNLTGESAVIVDVLKTLTVRPILVADIIQWFDDENLGELDPIANAWTGSLVDLVLNPATPIEIATGIRDLFKHLAKRTSVSIESNLPTWSVKIYGLIQALIYMQSITEEQVGKFYALGGGLAFPDITVDQFNLQKQEAILVQATIEANEAKENIINSSIGLINDFAASLTVLVRNADPLLTNDQIRDLLIGTWNTLVEASED